MIFGWLLIHVVFAFSNIAPSNIFLMQSNNQYTDSLQSEIKSITVDQLNALIINAKSDFTIVEIIASWCAPCRAQLSNGEVESFALNHKLNIIYVSLDYTSFELERLQQLRETFALQYNVYYVNQNVYGGGSFFFRKRLIRFLDELPGDADQGGGFPTYLLYNKNLDLLYGSVAKLDSAIVIPLIK